MVSSARTLSDEEVAAVAGLGVSFRMDSGSVTAVSGLSLSVRKGEVLAIVGESGSGKSVTANSLLGLLPPAATLSGSVIVRGRAGGPTDVVHATHEQLRAMRGRDVAMVFQEPSLALNPVFTVGWQIGEGLRAHQRLSEAEIRERSIDILRKVGIPDPERRMDDYPHQFSGGQKQRIVIAMALVLNAGLIIADEPTTALDVTVQAEILELLRICRDAFGATIILITHNMGVVADIADRVIVMYQGRIVEEAPVRQLFANPKEEYTRNLLAAVPHVGQGKSAEPAPARPVANTAPADSLVVAQGARIGYPAQFGGKGFVAVDGVDFWIAPGEVVGLVGESGSGKTTVGRAVIGLTSVIGGSLRVLGQELNGARPSAFSTLRREIGFVFQDPATSFNPLLTLGESIAEPMIVHKLVSGRADTRRRVLELLDIVQLPRAFADRYPHELSGGQRQRASLARGLALKPRLLIADEPTSALDVSVQARVLELFGELQRELAFASLFISHDLGVVDKVADRVIVMRRGKIREQGPTAQVLKAPEDTYTRHLLSSLPVPDPEEQALRRQAWQAIRGTAS